MRKALIPMLASLVLCGAATVAMVATNARAQTSPRKPVMVALVGPDAIMAQNAPPPSEERDMRTMRLPGAAEIKQICEDRYAREVGRMAYLETRLDLNQAEQPLFARWKDVELDVAKRRSADCGQRMVRDDQRMGNPAARMGREADMLKKRLADLDAERPVLAALYEALTPGQREMLSPRYHIGMAGGPADRGMMHREPMEMGDHSPPSPPQ
jgi:hypothetical protein